MADVRQYSAINTARSTDDFPLLWDDDGNEVALSALSPAYTGRGHAYAVLKGSANTANGFKSSSEPDWCDEHESPKAIALQPLRQAELEQSEKDSNDDEDDNSIHHYQHLINSRTEHGNNSY
ncbi:hypothetical protein SCUCBS95973_001177 [Sporothrix curviconia]|uniref:Uncharacterized protein n=1 Tax=Sporothrix curviconia TaxID=1260050 RepID=A0ABP0AWG8_9PEZI